MRVGPAYIGRAAEILLQIVKIFSQYQAKSYFIVALKGFGTTRLLNQHRSCLTVVAFKGLRDCGKNPKKEHVSLLIL